MLLNVQVEQAKRAYETGGREALAARSAEIPADHASAKFYSRIPTAPTCSPGRLIRSWSECPSAAAGVFPSPSAADRPMIARARFQPPYRLFLIDQRRKLTWFFFLQPQHLWIIGLVVLLCYGFAYHLTSPVRRLRSVVDCFGRGDFSARAPRFPQG